MADRGRQRVLQLDRVPQRIPASTSWIDLAKARTTALPSTRTADQGYFTPAAGTGSLDLSRGSATLEDGGSALRGERDIFGAPFSSAGWASAVLGSTRNAAGTWTGGTWNGRTWAGTTWAGGRYACATWAGGSWAGTAWASVTYSGKRWTGGSWTGAAWSSFAWS